MNMIGYAVDGENLTIKFPTFVEDACVDGLFKLRSDEGQAIPSSPNTMEIKLGER